MKRDLTIIGISFIFTAIAVYLTMFSTVEYFMLFPLAFTIFFGYSVAAIKEYLRSKDEANEYKAVDFPAKYLYLGNGINVLLCIGVVIMDLASSDMFAGLASMLVLIYIAPIIVGTYIITFCINYFITHKKK